MVADVTVVGAGIIALTTAVALADRGLDVRLVGTTHQGEASPAAAGMLVPSVEPELAPIRALAIEARDAYPAYLDALTERTGIAVPLNREGTLQVAFSETAGAALRSAMAEGATWLSGRDVVALEPCLCNVAGAVLSPTDGCVDPLPLLDALRLLVSQHAKITVVSENVCNVSVSSDDTYEVVTDREGRYDAPAVVLAAGAWTPLIEGLPHHPPIEPVRGQMITFAMSGHRSHGAPLRHVTYGPHGYLVPKADGRCMAGSTLEHAGFDAEVTDAGLGAIRAMAAVLCPSLGAAHEHAAWAGLRPMTPDLLPIIGPDPECPRLFYSCGHSRNGILLGPVSAEIVADFVTGTASPRIAKYDISRFRPGRF